MMRWKTTLLITVMIMALGACQQSSSRGGGGGQAVQLEPEPGPDDIRNQPKSVMLQAIGPQEGKVDDQDDLLKYMDVKLRPYLASLRRTKTGSFQILFKGGEGVEVKNFKDLMTVKLKKKERHSILVDVRGKTTLRVMLHNSKALEGGVVEIRRR